jgi:hypothetical protein
VPVGIEHHPNLVLRLHRRELRPRPDGVRDRGVEVGDGDIEVLGRMLAARLAGPDRLGPLRLVLETEGDLAGGADLGPAGQLRLARARTLLSGDRPAE